MNTLFNPPFSDKYNQTIASENPPIPTVPRETRQKTISNGSLSSRLAKLKVHVPWKRPMEIKAASQQKQVAKTVVKLSSSQKSKIKGGLKMRRLQSYGFGRTTEPSKAPPRPQADSNFIRVDYSSTYISQVP